MDLLPSSDVVAEDRRLQSVCKLGTVQKHGTGWRARALFSSTHEVTGPTHHGRDARRKADADLAQARQASTRDEMQQCLRDMKVVSARAAGPSVAIGAPLLRALVIQAEWCEQIFELQHAWSLRYCEERHVHARWGGYIG